MRTETIHGTIAGTPLLLEAADEIERLTRIEVEYIQMHEAMATLREAFDQVHDGRH